MAAWFSPYPDSLPRDQITTHGWFLSRSTMRRIRSRNASRHTGSAVGCG